MGILASSIFGSSAGGATYPEVADYASLPAASSAVGEIYVVLNGSGVWPLRKQAGLYVSDGATWTRLGILSAANVNYDNTTSGLTANDVKSAIDELASSGGGVTDHGLLTGLADDDHTQYLINDGTRGGQSITAALDIIGATDDVQLLVKGNATQTANIFEVQNSSGTVKAGVDPTGAAFSSRGIAGSVILGENIDSGITGANNIIIGQSTWNVDAVGGAVAIGHNTTNQAANGVAIGTGTTVVGTNSVVVGPSSTINGSGVVVGGAAIGAGGCVAIGYLTDAGTDSTVVGDKAGSGTTTTGSVYIGHDAGTSATRNNTLIIENSTNLTTPLIYGEFDNKALGVGTATLGSDAILDAGGTTASGYMYMPRMTTTERDALTPAAGAVIFNTTTTQFEGYDGTSWNAM